MFLRALQQQMQALAGMLNMTQDSECSCEEAYQLMDEYVELKQQGADTRQLMPLIDAHFAMCDCCRGELETLQAIIAAESGS